MFGEQIICPFLLLLKVICPEPFLSFPCHHPWLAFSYLNHCKSFLVHLIVSPFLSLQSVFNISTRVILLNRLDHMIPLPKIFQLLPLLFRVKAKVSAWFRVKAKVSAWSVSQPLHFFQFISHPPSLFSHSLFTLALLHQKSQAYFSFRMFVLTVTTSTWNVLPTDICWLLCSFQVFIQILPYSWANLFPAIQYNVLTLPNTSPLPFLAWFLRS